MNLTDSFKEKLKDLDKTIVLTSSEDEVDACVCSFLSSSIVEDVIDRCKADAVFYENARQVVQKCMENLYSNSALLRHAIEKPYGYPGDYEILEHIYDGKSFISSSAPCGGAIDQWAIKTALPAAVRSRKNILSTILKDSSASSVLSIGSGSAREIREMEETSLMMNIDLIDFDRRGFEAFSFSDKVNFHRRNVLRRLKMNTTQYDLIYSFGLFDYLEDDKIDAIITECKSLLEEGGEFIFCLKDHQYYSSWFYDVFCDWRFVERTRASGHEIAERNGFTITNEITTLNNVVTVYRCKRVYNVVNFDRA